MDANGNGHLTKTRSESHSVLIQDDDNNNDNETVVGGESVRSSRCSSLAWSDAATDYIKTADQFRSLERRSSVENFGQFGFLVPALALFPHADGTDALTQQFGDLQGKHRELKLAAAHIDDALNGRGGYGKARSYFKPPLARRCFKILNNPWFRRVMMFNILLHSLAILFEPPSVSLQEISPFVFILDLYCIVVYVFDLAVNITFLTWPVFWSRKAEPRVWNGIQFVLVCMFILDYILFIISAFTHTYIPQVFRCFRLAVLLCKAKNIRHILMVLLTIGFKLSKVFAIIFVFVWVSSCIGLYLLMDVYECRHVANSTAQITTYQGKDIPCTVKSREQVYNGTFDHVGLGMLRLFVLLSTENYPEVMLPSLRVQSWYFFFFGSYVFFGVFFLTAIVLAIVVDSYWLFAKKHVKKERARERAELAKAWNLLDPLGHGALSIQDEKFVELFRLLKPKNHDDENMQLIEMLDTNEDDEVDSFEWTTMLSQVLGYEFEEEDELTFDDFPCTSKCFYGMREVAVQITETVLFTRLILILIIIHCIIFSLKWKGQKYEEELILQVLRTIIVTIFLFEGLMRCIVLGKKIISLLEIMDVALILIAFCANLAWYTFDHDSRSHFNDYTTVVSCLAVFCRLPFNNSQLKRAIEVFIRIAPVMIDLIFILFIILYLFAAVGMELFRNSPVVEQDGHMYLKECGIGFNTFPCACLILFQMVTTSNWHEIMNSVISSTGQFWTSLYFVLAYVLLNMVVMNLFVAIAIEAFNKLATLEEQQYPGVARQLSDQRPTTALKTSVKSQAVEVLNSFASSIFGSARAEQVVERRQSLAPSIGGRVGNLKRGSIAVPKAGGTLSEEDEQSEDDIDNNKDKRERKLKKRMKEKKKTKRKISAAGNKVRVVTTFKGASSTDLDLTVGDEITIIQKTENWWQGHCKNRVGWFPASHVVMGTIKAIPEYHKRGKKGAQENESETEELEKTQVMELTREKSLPPPFVPENSFLRERAATLSSQTPGTPPVRGRVKVKKTGDWRKEILGEMTVMNAEEMRELNNIMRAELRTPVGRSRSKKLSILGWESGEMRDSVFQEENEHIDLGQGSRPPSARSVEPRPFSGRYHPPSSPGHGRNAVRPISGQLPSSRHGDLPEIKSKPKVPDLFVAPGTPTSRRKSEHRRESENRVQRLEVKSKPSPSPPRTKGKPKPDKKKNGEMPDWMLKFVNDKQLTVGDDVKLDETKQQKGRRSSSTAGLSTRTGTGTSKSSTGTGTLKSGTGTIKSRSTGNIPSDLETTQGKKKNSPQIRKKSLAPVAVPGKVSVSSATVSRVWDNR